MKKKYLQKHGMAYDVNLQLDIADETAGKKVTQVSGNKQGETESVSMFTSQINERLKAQGKISLKEGDKFRVSLQAKSQSLSQSFELVDNSDVPAFAAEAAGVVSQ